MHVHLCVCVCGGGGGGGGLQIFNNSIWSKLILDDSGGLSEVQVN